MNSNLSQNNYIVIPNFISSYRAIELAEEFKNYCFMMDLRGDSQVSNSRSKYNYISFLELLTEKTQEVSSILEETVLPTYTYSRVYLNGSSLRKHVDRDPCEISITVHLDGDKPWPICVETPSGEERCVTLNPGDAMMYFGRTAKHWRDSYDGEYYTQVFLHYVRSRGDCAYAYFDNREENNNKEDEKMNQIIEEQQEKISTPTLIVPQSRTKLEDYIHVFDNILPKHFCQEILEEYKHCDHWAPALVAGGFESKDSRNCNQILISDHHVISHNEEIRRSIDERIHKCVAEAMELYTEKHPLFNVEIDTGYQLLRYQEGQYYTQHTDSFKQEQRSVSCSIQLNEDYEGGEFAFFNREIIMRTGVGSVIMFPSNFMYPHEVMPVQKGTRYSIITWLV
jgi:predicted 2-oxoglutarate/Fe(II)-dependent dioxygenase YbiX